MQEAQQMVMALMHARHAIVSIRAVGQVTVIQGPLAVSVWMPLVSAAESAGLKAGSMPGWRAAMALLASMGVNLEQDPDIVDTDQDGRAGVSYLWCAPNAEPLPGGVVHERTWTRDETGWSMVVTPLETSRDLNVTSHTRVWHVGFTTEAVAAQVAESLVGV